MVASNENQAAFHRLVGRALYDSGFRARLMDPKQRPGALAEAGLSVSPQQSASLDRVSIS